MPKNLGVLTYTVIFILLLFASVPRKEIKGLIIYGIVFGAQLDIIALSSGKIIGLYEFIDFAPFGYWVFPFFGPISMLLHQKFLPFQYLRLVAPIVVFSIWIPFSTWGY